MRISATSAKSDFLLRQTNLNDMEELSALIHASYDILMRDAYGDENLNSILPMIAHANSKLVASGRYYLIYRKSDLKFVACGGWSPFRPGTGNDGKTDYARGPANIRHVATHPEFLGLGFARRIVEQCFADARAMQFQDMECLSSLNAVPFYESVGFATIENVEVSLPQDTTMKSVFMLAKL
ncbi:MAG: GNAT family N-acetyltransferase [Alphaproteobacteria bacterium]|nr:GNAT family N-acetyltransferase [Alphaproteobacteria bacterium]